MAQNVKKKNSKSRSQEPSVTSVPSNDNLLWMVGFVMLVLGVISFCSVCSHFLHWSSDLSALRNDEELTGVVVPFENVCSRLGAMIAYWVVDCSFGVFGIIIPIVITVLGWRIFRKKALHLNHFALSAALLLVMGALTLGFVGLQFAVPYDIGGRLGHACAMDLSQIIGTFGMIVLLLAGWVLTGVFINRNFIHIVNGFSDTMVHQSERLATVVKDTVVKNRKEEVSDEEDSAGDSETEAGDDVREGYSVNSQVSGGSTSISMSDVPMAQGAEQNIAPQQMSYQPQEAQITPSVRPVSRPTELVAEEDDEFYVESVNAPNDGKATDVANAHLEPQEPQFDEDGFMVIPNSGAIPNKINVDILMSRDKSGEAQTVSDDGAKDNADNLFDEDGFAVVARGEEGATEGVLPAAKKSEYDFSTPEVKMPLPKDSAAAVAEEEDGIIVTVRENKPKQLAESEVDFELYDPLRDLESYKKPYVSLLEDYKSPHKVSDAEIYDNKCRIQETLKYFGIPILDIHATVGPTVTLYEIVQAQGVKISKIQGLEKDIAQSLKSLGIRIIAPIPGRGTIGIEVPNRDKQIVSMYSSICSEEFQSSKAELPIVIGRTIQNENYTFDLAKMPHLLVAGATGQGKSVGLNAIITSLLYRKHPAELKFVMIDPKMVEFSIYNKLERHFLAKMESEDEAIITEPKKAVYALNSLVEEMGRRLELCKMATARNIVEYNQKFVSRRLNPQKGHRFLPYIVVIVDEFADLIMTAKEVEVPVMRLAQKARAVGIHLIIATQRPDVKIITGGIKANFPARIAFRVMQMIDSRTIIDQPGANQLIGRGDMLFSNNGELTRVQCALVETREVERLVDFISKQQGYPDAYPLPDFVPDNSDGGGGASDSESGAPVKYDMLFGEVARAAVTNGMISTSAIQRNYEVGFNRAGRIMLQLERAGIVGPQVGSKPREIKYYDLPSLEAKLQDLGVF
ncbi:MAG: DNA translocase FtsK 4TM domain-containing protein [Alistipes sp.]|nr:DNA translocase FtsK 4TM domain-containing protein [Alistipes sp.]